MMTLDQDVPPVLLIIDDEPGMVALVSRFAQDQGFRAIGRSGRKEMMAELASLNAEAAIVDLRMPEVSGLEVLKAIHDADPTCQVILMTAHASVDSAIEAVKLGALDYLSKPLDFERLGELLTTVKRSIDRRRLLLAGHS